MRIDPNTVSQIAAVAPTASGKLPERADVSHRAKTTAKTSVRDSSSGPVQRLPQPTQKEVSVQWNEDQVMVIRFLDQKTGAVLGQVPSEEMLRVVHSIRELLQRQAASPESKS